MKRHIITFVLAFILLPVLSLAQDKKLTIEDASYMNRSLFPSSMSGLKWMGNTNLFTYNEGNDVMASKATSYKPYKLFSLDDINGSLN